MPFDAIVLGAGAAGLMCAAQAAKLGCRVALADHMAEAGKKILISGGGRCNFTNLHTTAANFVSANPHFSKSALARYTPNDFVELVEKHRIPFHEKKLGQLFCDRSAGDILRMLLAECEAGQVRLLLGARITAVRKADCFAVETTAGSLEAAALVVATGGLSIPKLGATPFAYQLAAQFDVPVVKPRPALVPLTFQAADRDRWCDLAGVATDVAVATSAQTFDERMLITHKGFSGPAILQISTYWDPREPITVDLLRGHDLASAWLNRGQKSMASLLAEFLPKRLADRWATQHAGLTADQMADALRAWRVHPSGTEGFEKAEVTAGGVDTGALSSKTLECRNVPGLYFIGEAVDVTGQLGGFNFQWAWASGIAAARALAIAASS